MEHGENLPEEDMELTTESSKSAKDSSSATHGKNGASKSKKARMDIDEEDEEEDDDDLDDDEDDDDEDDDDDDDEEDEDEEAENKQDLLNEQDFKHKLTELESMISENKFQYQPYVDIIKLTRDNGDFNKLREYRLKMSELFPLTETLWLEWLKDEQKYLESEEDRKRVDKLFQKAVEDYLSVNLWLEYIQFSIGGMGEENGVENIRNICESATSFAGLHVTKGYSLWEAYREFESALLAGYQQSSAGSVQTPEMARQINNQIERIYKIFESQLRVCLDNSDSTYDELRQFDETKANDEPIRVDYERSMKKFKQIEPFENELGEAEKDAAKKLEIYKRYIDFELKLIRDIEKNKRADPAPLDHDRLRLKCLFERAIADETNCLDVDLWIKYITYLNEEETLEHNPASKDFNLKVAKRSIRNCPWSSKLWINYALELEKTNKSDSDIKGAFNDAMNAGLQTSDDYLQMWHFYLDYMKRSLLNNFDKETDQRKEQIMEELREIFQKAINQLFDYFKLNGDPTFSLEKYWAQVEAKYFRNMEKARKIYNEMILAKSDIGSYASSIWLEFYDLEKQHGDEKHQRRLLQRALNELVDLNEKEFIFDSFLKFEKINGNVHQFAAIYAKYENFKREQAAQLAAELAKKQSFDKNNQSKKKKDTINPKQQPKLDASKKLTEVNNLKRKKSDNEENAKPNSKDSDGFLIPTLPTANENVVKKSKANDSEELSTGKKFDSMNSNLTVFISNLSYDVDENKIKEAFEKLPGFKEVRLIRHWSGKTKGYGYVDFARPDQAENALKLDRTPIDGRPMFVSRNEDKSLNFGVSKFKYSTNLEKTKLFISGLPFTTDKPALEEIFKNFGKVKEIRIVTYKSGKSKGLAYVEFEDEQSASKALIQTDGMLIGENQISVAISNPPRRKQPGALDSNADDKEEKKEKLKMSLGGGAVTSRASNSTASSNTGANAGSSSSSTSSIASFIPRSQQLLGRKKTLNLS